MVASGRIKNFYLINWSIFGVFEVYLHVKMLTFCNVIIIRAFRTDTKLRLLTKIDFNVMHLVSLCKFFWQKLQIRGSRDLQNSVLYPASIWALQQQEILIRIFLQIFSSISKFSRPKSIRRIFTT